MLFACEVCRAQRKGIEGINEEIKILKSEMEGIKNLVKQIKNDKAESKGEHRTLLKKIDDIGKKENTDNLYSTKLKSKTKNTLVIKSTDVSCKASENKDNILKSLKEVQIENFKTAKAGHIVLNFSDKETLNKAKGEIDKKREENRIEANIKEKRKPKIMLCHVSKEENEGKLIENIWNKKYFFT